MTFGGFGHGKTRMVQLPVAFIDDLLPLVDDLGELKVILFSLWALQQREGKRRYLRYNDYAHDADLRVGLQAAKTTLDEALARAVARGALLHEQGLYFANTPNGREAVRQLRAGTWRSNEDGGAVAILPPQSNIYELWHANFGALTPIISDALKEAEREYPYEWIAAALQEAVKQNKRNWKYVAKILENRATQEGHHGNAEKPAAGFAGRLSDYIDRS
jgi:DNA replication protein